MPELYYTAVIKDGKVFVDENGLVYAEHFEDAAERDKRARQFSSACLDGTGNLLYQGTRAPEAALATAQYLVDHPQTEDMDQKARDKIMTDALIAGDRAGDKTVSKLTAPEIDDSDEKRGLPDWAIAQHEVEAATQAVIDAKAAVEAKTRTADALVEAAKKPRDADSPAMTGEQIAAQVHEAHAKASGALTEVDRATGALYLAEQDLAAKIAAYEKIKPKEGKNA